MLVSWCCAAFLPPSGEGQERAAGERAGELGEVGAAAATAQQSGGERAAV